MLGCPGSTRENTSPSSHSQASSLVAPRALRRGARGHIISRLNLRDDTRQSYSDAEGPWSTEGKEARRRRGVDSHELRAQAFEVRVSSPGVAARLDLGVTSNKYIYIYIYVYIHRYIFIQSPTPKGRGPCFSRSSPRRLAAARGATAGARAAHAARSDVRGKRPGQGAVWRADVSLLGWSARGFAPDGLTDPTVPVGVYLLTLISTRLRSAASDRFR